MKKEKVYIVLLRKYAPKKGTKTGAAGTNSKDVVWELIETAEFVNKLSTRHLSTSTAIGDYINRKMLSGERYGLGEYTQFEAYIKAKYGPQLAELDAAYLSFQVPFEVTHPVIDKTGTVFDPAS